jgi:hypothetical protein
MSAVSSSTLEWSLTGPDSPLVDNTVVPETPLQVPLTTSLDRKSLEEIKFKVSKYFTSIKVGFIKLGEPDPADIQVFKKELFYIPFWVCQGSYACRYVRKTAYTTTLSTDVEEVRINGESQQIAIERRRISDVVAEVASSSAIPVGVGPVPLAPFQGSIRMGMQKGFSSGMKAMLKGRDKEVARKNQLTINAEEIASYALKSELCINSHLGSQDRKTLRALRDVTRFESPNEESLNNALPIHFTKSDVLSELRKEIVKLPEVRPRRILEQVAITSKLDLVYVPYYRFVVESKGKTKLIEFNILTGEDYSRTSVL